MFACGLNYDDLSTGIEPKKGEEDGKYIPISIRMQRTQVESQLKTTFFSSFLFLDKLHVMKNKC